MDDEFEPPVAKVATSNAPGEEEEESSGEEDALDWTKLPGLISRPVIPKRGEKEYEPVPGGGSSLQEYTLERSRNAMLDALRATRGSSSRSISYAVWDPTIARAYVLHPKGSHFSSMGHSARRPNPDLSSNVKIITRLELLPEEALYLIERGSVFCYKYEGERTLDPEFGDTALGTPMSVQQAFAEMIGKEDLTLERYQIYSYLKRLGFVASRARPPASSPLYPRPPPYDLHPRPRLLDLLFRPFRWISTIFSRAFSWLSFSGSNWTSPLSWSRLYHGWTYATVFKTLRIIPRGHTVPLRSSLTPLQSNTSPYQVFYHLWKPSTTYKKSAPPLPDFELVVVNARTTPLPTLAELTTLFSALPLLKPPVPRQRQPSTTGATKPSVLDEPSLISRLFRRTKPPPPPQWKPNPFAMLKSGRKHVVIGAVDNGTSTFMRFGEGGFEDWPMM